MKSTFTDLHTHILPGVDDGAKTLEEALQMLRMQKINGVERVALTPHFYPLREELQVFLEKRQKAYDKLLSNWDGENMPQLQLGAEVHYSPELVEKELCSLTIGQGRYLLLELSNMTVPAHMEEVLRIMLEQGLMPVLAHVERCIYFREQPDRLVRLVEQGALAQITAAALINKRTRHFAEICLKKNVAQIVASDIHTLAEDAVCLGNVANRTDGALIANGESFARAVWDNMPHPTFAVSPIKKNILGYC